MWDAIRGDPRRYAGVIYLNIQSFLRQFFALEDYLPVFLPALGLGLFGSAWTRRRAKRELVLIAAAVPPLTFLLFFIFARYVSPLLLIMLPWTALGIVSLGEWLRGTTIALVPTAGKRWLQLSWWAPIAVAAIILLGLHPRTLAAVSNPQAGRLEHRAAGEWLASNAPAEAVVMARYPAIAFHADRYWIPSPNSALEPALRYAKSKGTTIWVVDSNEGKWRPELEALSRGETPVQLELLHTEGGAGVAVYIYRLR
jgi:hypothetical protein